MATPADAARELVRGLPAGPYLELCCGVGGLTRQLARRGPVLAVDRRADRLAACRANLQAAGARHPVNFLCTDLTRPALGPDPRGLPFTAALLDPDWSPLGASPAAWTADPEEMTPPVAALVRLALRLAPLAVLRLPPDLEPPLITRVDIRKIKPFRREGRTRFQWIYFSPC